MERFKSNLLLLPERVSGATSGTYLKRRESWIQLKACMKRLQGTNITYYSFRYYYALRYYLKLIDSDSATLSKGYSIEAHHKNYPYSKEFSTTNIFKNLGRKTWLNC